MVDGARARCGEPVTTEIFPPRWCRRWGDGVSCRWADGEPVRAEKKRDGPDSTDGFGLRLKDSGVFRSWPKGSSSRTWPWTATSWSLSSSSKSSSSRSSVDGGVRAFGADFVQLVPPGDADALAARVLELLADPARAQAAADRGGATIREHHSLEQAGRRFEAALR